jgi:D-alanyl-D-alanine carboxypeptidase
MCRKVFSKIILMLIIVVAIVIGVIMLFPHIAPMVKIGFMPKKEIICEDKCVKDLQAILDKYRSKNNIPGIQMTINLSARQPMQTFSSGTITKGGIAPITENTVFQIGSTTKSFTAAIILQLNAEGKLQLTDTIGKWFPQEYPAWHNITIDNLLRMSSPAFDTFGSDGGVFLKVYQENPQYIWTAKQLSDFAYQHGPFCSRANAALHTPFCPETPGKGWSYSNTNYILLTQIAEKASGKTFKELMYQQLFEPLGLTTAIYDPQINSATIKNIAHGYSNDSTSKFYHHDVTDFSLSAAQGAGAIVASTGDLAKWVRALFSGKVMSKKQFAEMTKTICMKDSDDCKAGDFIPPNSKEVSYGYGIMKGFGFSKPTTDKDILWLHTGGSMGQATLFLYDQKHDFVFTAVQNIIPQGELMKLAFEVEKYLFSDIVVQKK